ncbi:peroxynitrite isomerase THAP4-like [Oscarella lobularis]|uniref:peroxynitrite isomerase THAP4-like n=1 Tax=Oscarella lobularis TaxID=121494 RepID=UPI00331442CA
MSTDSLRWLAGKWTGEGRGFYPTIDSFEYEEEIEFQRIPNKPVLKYDCKTWHPVDKTPMHLESGFLKMKPGTNQVAFSIAENIAITEMSEGTLTDNSLSVTTQSIGRSGFNKEPSVLKVQRDYRLTPDGDLEYTISMQTATQPLQEHLRAKLKKF